MTATATATVECRDIQESVNTKNQIQAASTNKTHQLNTVKKRQTLTVRGGKRKYR